MKKAVVAVTAIIVLAGLAVAAVPVVERRAADNIKAQIEADGTSSVGSVSVGLFDRSVTFDNFHVKGEGETAVRQWVLSGLAWPLGELLRGNTPFAGWQPGQPMHADHLELKDVRHVEPAGSTLSIVSLSVDGLDLARYDSAVAPTPRRSSVLGARIIRAISLRHMEMQGFGFTENSLGGFSLESLAVSDLGHGKFGALTLSGFQLNTASASAPVFRIDQTKITGLDLDRVLAALSAEAWRPGMPVGRIDIEDARVSGFSGEAMARYGISLDSITVTVKHDAPGVSHTQARIDGFVLAPPLSGAEGLQMRMTLAAMGLKDLRLGFDCSGSEDRNKGVLGIDRCALTGQDLGEIDLSANFQDADAAFWKAVDSGNVFGIYRSNVALGSARLVLADKSLLNRLFRAIATASGQTVEAARAAVAQQVRQYQPTGVLITDDMTSLLDTAARFVEKGGTLTVDLKPDPPFGMDRLPALGSAGGADLVSLLGVTATLAPPH
ncbi:MAG TPA: hypothetical protein VFB13_02750 [Reyranella sp.]|nr:hypothetical protein [Reyranella sp.]